MANRGRNFERNDYEKDDDYDRFDKNEKKNKPDKPQSKADFGDKQGDKQRVKVTQPNPHSEVWDYENHWQKNFTDCCEDGKVCCYAWCCPCCFLGSLFRRTGECCCMFCIPGSLMSLRSKLRTGFRIKGTLCRDCVAATCCCLCTAIQMKMELDKQEL